MDRPAILEVNEIPEVTHEVPHEVAHEVARRAMVTSERILVFHDFTDTLTEMFKLLDRNQGEVLAAGHATPDLAIAVDRAELRLTEILGESPFCGDTHNLLEAIKRGDENVYLSNPNRITGAHFSLSELARIARALPHGTLIIDEHYFDFCGISGVPLLDDFNNVVILRSFTTDFGAGSDTGFIVARADLIRHLGESCRWRTLSATVKNVVMTALTEDAGQGKRLMNLHDESLRLATELSKLGVQCRISPTDFLVLRVADPTGVGNYLAAVREPIENLDGYPGLKHYVRYVVRSEESNDRFLRGFRKMPREYYRLKDIDRRPMKLIGIAERDTDSPEKQLFDDKSADGQDFL